MGNFFGNSRLFGEACNGKELFGGFSGTAAIICGAGASLEKEIPYFRKPLLYSKVVEGFRRAHLMKAAERMAASEVPSEEPSDAEVPCCEPGAPKRKKWFGLFGK